MDTQGIRGVVPTDHSVISTQTAGHSLISALFKSTESVYNVGLVGQLVDSKWVV